jgi:ribosomal protein RSM22 (predicted rRNA methylase)
MTKVGLLKSKLLKKLTETYSTDNKVEMKSILKLVKENKDFKDLYLFYEEMENKYFDDKEVANLYVEELTKFLKSKSPNLMEFANSLDQKLGDQQVNENELYNALDTLLEEDSLNNIDKKVISKKKLVEHLTTKKVSVQVEDATHTANENLLHAVLANNFNVLYGKTLSEEQKEQLKHILALTEDELALQTTELKESILNQVNTLLSESTDNDFNTKLNQVKDEVQQMETSKYNFFKLTELKNGL